MDALRSLLTDAQVADWLAVPPSRVRKWAKAGKIPCLTLPDGSYLFDPAELDQWAATLRTGAGAGAVTAGQPATVGGAV